MIIAWDQCGVGASLFTDHDARHNLNHNKTVIRGVYVENGDTFVFLDRRSGSWKLLRSNWELFFDTGTDNLDAAVTIINLLFDTQ